MSIFGTGTFGQSLVKPRVFVSYHHALDQGWYDQFTSLFSGTYEAVTDCSVRQQIDSEDPEYIERRIRENHIHGTSCTIVLCGAQTPKRKYVDWEIYATLYKQHGLLGIILPSLQPNHDNKYIVPDRLHANIESGYATWMRWSNSPVDLRAGVDRARQLSSNSTRIRNSEPKMRRNR